ncbi:MAG: hypothetical protein RI965_342 [Bacteroidota bacterium]|jgi:hypothetical protein
MPKEIVIPYNFSPREYQLEFLQAPQRFKIAVFHRRAGKSKTVINEQIRKTQLPELAGKIFYYFLPTYRQAKSVVWDELVKQHVPMEIVSKINESELAIYYKNGSIQRFVGCDDIDKHRGINPIDVVFDEFSEMNPDIWHAIIQPVLRENHGTATWIFTPKGRNHAWELIQRARDNPNEWFVSIKGVDDTLALTQTEIDEARSTTPEAYFRQEYLCDFLDSAGAFFRRIRENTYDPNDQRFSNDYDQPHPKHLYQMGIDLAKYNDWTVITPFDLHTYRVKKQQRFNQIDWNLQKAVIEAEARKYNNAKLMLDRTGVGDPIVEDLERRGLNIGDDGAVVFTKQTRRDLLDHLAILLQRDKIKIPNDPGLIAELESFQFSLNSKGKLEVKGGAKSSNDKNSGLHDDRVFSLALAVWGVNPDLKDLFTSDDNAFSQEDEYDSDKDFDRFAVI